MNKITVNKWFNDDWRQFQTVKLNGQIISELFDLSECPEDATLARDMLSAEDIIKFINIGIAIGTSGEKIDEVEWIDEEVPKLFKALDELNEKHGTEVATDG